MTTRALPSSDSVYLRLFVKRALLEIIKAGDTFRLPFKSFCSDDNVVGSNALADKYVARNLAYMGIELFRGIWWFGLGVATTFHILTRV